MRLKKFGSILCSILALTFVLATIPFVSGCDGAEEYRSMVEDYDKYVKTYTDIFDEYGNVKIAYNSAVTNEINKTTLAAKKAKFTRLTNNTESDQAIYEPVLKASLLYVKTYIHTGSQLKISNGTAKNLSQKLDTLVSKTNNFRTQRALLEAHSDSFGSGSETQDNNLTPVLTAMYELVKAANDFGYSFMKFFEDGIKKVGNYDENNRYGTIERFYLKNLTLTCNAYVKVYLPLIHHSDAIETLDGTQELYTSYNYSKFVNDMLNDFLANYNDMRLLDKKTTDMTSNEANAFEYYKYVYEYGMLYRKSCRVMISVADEWREAKQAYIVAQYSTPQGNITTEYESLLGFVEDCHNDCLVMQKMLKEFTSRI